VSGEGAFPLTIDSLLKLNKLIPLAVVAPHSHKSLIPQRDGKDFKGFLPHWTNSILQQLKRKFWKIADALFRISRMTNSFK
jgi:hypothetical protein